MFYIAIFVKVFVHNDSKIEADHIYFQKKLVNYPTNFTIILSNTYVSLTQCFQY